MPGAQALVACDHLILDTCCVINLYASRRMEEILRSLLCQIAVAEYVKDVELLQVYWGPIDHVKKVAKRIDLESFFQSGLLALASLETEAEQIEFVNFAAELDDGEAITAAIALCRGWAIATDDKKAIRRIRRRAPKLQILSTPEIVKHWADRGRLPRDAIGGVLLDIRLRASYEPGVDHPLHDWWAAHIR